MAWPATGVGFAPTTQPIPAAVIVGPPGSIAPPINDIETGVLQVAHDHPLILEDPGPLATMEGFGDSTLDLVLRCYLPDLENRLSVVSQLHTEIDRKFREASIEIAFPQRDIHIRSIQGPLKTVAEKSESELPFS